MQASQETKIEKATPKKKSFVYKKAILETVKESKIKDNVIKLLRDFLNQPKIKALPENSEIPFEDFIEFASQTMKSPHALDFLNDKDFTKKPYANFFKIWMGKLSERLLFEGYPDKQNLVIGYLDIRTLMNVSMVDKTRNKWARIELDKKIKALLKLSKIRLEHFASHYYQNYADRAWAVFQDLYPDYRFSPVARHFYIMLHIGDDAVKKQLAGDHFTKGYMNGRRHKFEEKLYGPHPLTLAVQQGHINLVHFLLTKKLKKKLKFDLPRYVMHDEHPLEAAARTGRREIVEILLQAYDVINIQGTELGLAAEGGFHEIAIRLKATKAEFKLSTNTFKKVASKGDKEMLQIILPLDKTNSAHHPDVIIEAARHGHVEVVKLLHESKVDITQHDNGKTAIAYAVVAKHTETARYLLENKADANQTLLNGINWRLLHAASGATFNDFNFSWDVFRDYSRPNISTIVSPELISLLLDHKADIHARAPDGSAALHFAARSGSTAAVKVLLDKGADTKIRNDKKCVAAEFAANDEVRQVFLQHEAAALNAEIEKQRAESKKMEDSKETQPMVLSTVPGAMFSQPPAVSSSLDAMQIMTARLLLPINDKEKQHFASLARIIEIALQMQSETTPAINALVKL